VPKINIAVDCAAFPKNSGDGHHFINKSDAVAVYIEAGARSPADTTICSDIDMMSSNADGRSTLRNRAPRRVHSSISIA
jgi:uncharacterized cupin superfamily protein